MITNQNKMSNTLVVVESPNKVTKIQKLLSKADPKRKFQVVASVGHILDLDKGKGSLGVDLENNYQPDYVAIATKKQIISRLKTARRSANEVWIASDLDQEGEFIGYSICQVLGLPFFETPRLIFNEITQTAISHAVANPVRLNQNLLNAQKCRRITDRLIGFQISQVARKVNRSISVGRVKTMMVKIVSDREQERQKFQEESYFRLEGDFQLIGRDIPIKAHSKKHFKDESSAHGYLNRFVDKPEVEITKIKDHIVHEHPKEPFMTSSLQKNASRQLNLSPKMVLSVAQQLYEKGLISYPRTDTTRLPDEKHKEIKERVLKLYGDDYYCYRTEKKHQTNTQEAHAAIYPTDLEITRLTDSETDLEKRLYLLIYKRTMASQMTSAKFRQLDLEFAHHDEQSIIWNSQWRELIFDGFLILDEARTTNYTDLSILIESFKVGTKLFSKQVKAIEDWSKPPVRYDGAGLLEQMEKHGIGRPSTWGGILTETLSKGFLENHKELPETRERKTLTYKDSEIFKNVTEFHSSNERKRLKVTELGQTMIDFTEAHFSHIFNYQFTSDLEKELKKIEQKDHEWTETVDNLYRSYKPVLDRLKKDQAETARFKRQRDLGSYQEREVIAFVGRYGPVIKYNDIFYPIKKPYTLATVTLADVPQIIKDVEKEREISRLRQEQSVKVGKITIQEGPYGPYFRIGKATVSVPKEYHEKLSEITEEMCTMWIEQKKKSRKRK